MVKRKGKHPKGNKEDTIPEIPLSRREKVYQGIRDMVDRDIEMNRAMTERIERARDTAIHRLKELGKSLTKRKEE